jgi:hypothetical protein
MVRGSSKISQKGIACSDEEQSFFWLNAEPLENALRRAKDAPRIRVPKFRSLSAHVPAPCRNTWPKCYRYYTSFLPHSAQGAVS